MKRKIVLGGISVLILLSYLAVRSVYRSRRAAANRVAIQETLRHFSQMVPLGTSRGQVKNVLREQHVAFVERCCFEPNSPFSIVIPVGRQDAPWYCSEWVDYVAFEFSTSEGPHRATDILESDVVKLIHLTTNGEGCL
jgi:hypothetical protein